MQWMDYLNLLLDQDDLLKQEYDRGYEDGKDSGYEEGYDEGYNVACKEYDK